MHNVNIAVQILPMGIDKPTAYNTIDAAIQVVKASGLKHKVCPFETVIEGTYSEVMSTIEKMQQTVFDSGCEDILVNLKIQRSNHKNVSIEDKIGKYS